MDFTTVNRLAKRTRLSTTAQFIFLCGMAVFSSVSAQAQDPQRTRETSRALALPSRSAGSEAESSKGKSVSSSNSMVSTTISLGMIVGTILLVGYWMKKGGFHGAKSLPIEAFEVLGKRVIEPRVSVHLVKCGSRVLVLGVGAEGVRTLSEIDDPAEVRRLTEACQQTVKTDLQTFPREQDTKQSTATNPALKPSSNAHRAFVGLIAMSLFVMNGSTAHAQVARWGNGGAPAKAQADVVVPIRPRAVQPAGFENLKPEAVEHQQLMSPQQMGLSLKMLALMTIFSLAPSILMMTTCFVRFVVVLGLLRQAIGTQQGPPNQVLTAICLFLTFLVMSPVWQRCYREGIRPYTNPAQGEQSIDEATALSKTVAPVRDFMSQQIDKAGNSDAVWMLLDFQQSASDSAGADASDEPQSYDDVPFTVLAPAYLLSELKVGFLIGFQLFLPFLVIDLVIAVILTSLGLTMLPPSMVSLPFKLLLFVLIDGWFLTVGMLLESVKVA